MLTKGERIRGLHGIVAPARNLSLYLLLARPARLHVGVPIQLNRIVLEPRKPRWRAVVFQDVFGLNPQLICVAHNERNSSMSKIYVGNLPFSATEEAVRALFSQHGTVESVSLINDRETGRPRGFGFVEMSRADAQKAIQSLNGYDMGGRPLKVNEAQDKPRGGGGGGPRGGGGGGRW
jgi:hypothetical protein